MESTKLEEMKRVDRYIGGAERDRMDKREKR